MKKYKEHHPPHLYLNNQYYFITARIVNKYPHFREDSKKKILFGVLGKALKNFNLDIYAWVILDGHYHLLIYFLKGNNLSKFIQNINVNIARLINQFDNMTGRKIWYQYWDKCIRSKADFWKHFNYIHHNPVKHNYVKKQNLVKDYWFCSYRQWLEKQKEEWLMSCFYQYPVVDFTIDGDE